MALLLVGVISSAQATPANQDAEAVGNALESFGDRLASASDALGEYQDLANSLPLTDLAPGDPGALDLSNLLDDIFTPANLGTFDDMPDLAAEVDNLDGTYGGVTVQFGTGAFSQPAVSSTASSLTIPIHATRTVNQPLDFTFGPVDMAGGSLGIDFVLDTTLTFNVDTSAFSDADAAPATAVSVVPPTIDTCAHATGSVGVFTARFGFTDVKVSTDDPETSGTTETAALHACTDIVFQDPDSTGGITRDEWTSHALTELATASIVDGAADPANDLDVSFYVDASLIDGDAFVDVEEADASISFVDQNLAVGGFDPDPTPTLGKLDDWDNINAGDVANGLAQFVASLAGSQGEGNGPLPFLQKSLTETFDAVKPLTDYTALLTNAQVGCGTTPGDADSFPTGLTDNLAAGTFVFCRARTSMELDAGTVDWSPPSGVTNVDTDCTECLDENSDETLGNANVTPPGPNPTKDAVFKMTSAGNFAIELSWDSDPGAGTTTKKAIPRPGTAQELFAKLAAAAGLDTSGGNLSYASSTQALSFRLQKQNFDPLAVTTNASFGDLLRNATNLAGLQDSGSASFSANASDVDFDVTFGVVLVPNTSDITPLRGSATSSTGTVLTDSGANFLTGPNAPRLAQIVKNTTDGTQCTIAAVAATTLTCAPASTISWDSGDAYDVDGGLADRFYVQVDNDDAEPELSVGSLNVTGALNLTGKLGFLEIEAEGDGAKNGFDPGTAFGITKADASKPVVRVDIKTPDPFSVVTSGGPQSIPDAIGVADLLFHLDDAHLDAVCNLKASAGLAVSASVEGNPAFAKGGVGVSWPTVFEADSCTPDFSTLDIDADTDFDLSLKDFDPFPSVSGTHNGGNGDSNLEDTTKNFSANAVNGQNLLQLTLRNETTGASCTITTIDATHLNCSLSGGTRSGDTANNNKWKDGDEYSVEGNALALLGIILDHLDELVEQVDAIAPGQTDKEIPLIGISTKELVQKIQSVKQTLDDLRGAPLAAIDCSRNPNGTNTGNDNLGRPFDLSILPDNQIVYCRAVSTVEPDAVTWTAKALGTDGALLVGAPVNSLGAPAANGVLDTVGPSPTARVPITISDQNGTAADDTLIDEWRAMVEFTDAAGNHTAELPQASPPSSLQELERLIEDKLGVADPDVFKLDLLDLPDRGDDTPIVTGDHDDDAPTQQEDEVLHDDDTDFTSGGAGDPINGNLLVNKTDNLHCTITLVQDHDLTCAGANMQWDDGDEYEVVGNGTKDLIIRLGFGFCSAVEAGFGAGALCKDTDRDVEALNVPLNTDLGAAGDLVTLDTEGDLSLDFAARAQLDIGIPLKLDLTPDIAVLDTTKAEVEGRLNANGVGLSASIGPVAVELGTAVDLDGDPETDDPGTGVAKIGAELAINKDPDDAGDDALDDAIDNNRTFTIGDFFGDLDVTFQGADPDLECEDPSDPDSTGDACAALHVAVAGVAFPDPLRLTCTAEPLSCTPTLPDGLQALLDGKALSWELLLQVLPQLLTKLETELDGAAKDVSIPLIGDTLDAGADVVGTFNDNVVTPFANIVAEITDAADADGDDVIEPRDIARSVQTFIFSGAGDFDGLGPGGADLLLDLNRSGGQATIDDVVVTPLCTSSYTPCEVGHGLTDIRDLRVTFLLGDSLLDADVPFDIGLRGLPVRMTGGVSSDVDWSVFVDFGINEDGPYLRTSGPKSFAGGETGTDGLPGDVDAPDADTAITGTENEAKRAPDIDTNADDEDEDTEQDGPDAGADPDETPDGWQVINYLVDDDASFDGDVEPGMWLWNLDTEEGCRIYSVAATTLRCDDPTTTDDEGIDWHQTGATEGDNYAVIELHPPNVTDGGSPELGLKASVGIGTNASVNCTDNDHDYSTPGEPTQLTGFSTTRCLTGELAFLAVTIRDKDTGDVCPADLSAVNGDQEDPTQLCLRVNLDVTTSDDRVTVADLLSGDIGLSPSLTGHANVDVRFRTGLNVGQSSGFPSVLGKLHLYWGFAVDTDNGLDLDALLINFDALNLDAGKFISQFLTPIVKQVKNITGPLMPVVELLQGEVPIISDLSKLIGEGPVTVLDVLEAVSGNDLSLLRSILQFINFVNTIPSDGNLLIPLGGGPGGGSFDVSGERAGGDPPLPDEPDQGIENADASTNLIDDFAADPDYAKIDDAPDECDPNRGSTFGVCGLTFPFLGDASQIFGVLMGKDATLVRYDAGTFGAGAGFGFCFPPILIGPVPVQICIGGSFRVEGRFAVGYDTSGLRKVLEGGTGTHLLDGIFLDDYNAAGAEVPEVKFIGTVYAEGAVSVYIFKVGIRGEIIFTTSLDLHEDDPQDGKLRIEEIISRLPNPLCLFDVAGKIEAALSAFVEIDLFITSVEFSIEIVRITLLEFDLSVCDPEPPNLARVEGEVLFLHMGSSTERAKRNVAESEINEKFTVRQMESFTSGPNSGKTRFSITAFGIQEDEFLTTTAVNGGTAELRANADDGDDVIQLLPGGNSGTQSQPNQQNPPVPFRLDAVITGGSGADELTTGDGADDVRGGSEADRILTGIRADLIRGDAGDDKIDAGDDNDTDVRGGDGHDVINGGKGGDQLRGEGGNDVVSAGPDNGVFSDDLRGGDGNDTLTADLGDDFLYGDEVLSDCTADGTDTGAIQAADGSGGGDNNDALIGSDGDDELYGGEENDQLDGGKGDDTLCGGGGNDDIVGGENVDSVEGGSDDDNIVGDAGQVSSAGGGDTLNGGAGRDYMLGDDGSLARSGAAVIVTLATTFAGNDTMNGGAGDDFMWGEGGVDAMNGDANDDEMRGGADVDTMNGNTGDDEMYGEDAADVMHGNTGNDYMRGGPGIDTMDGDANSDEMYGDNDADVMRGGGDDDLMRGGSGDDDMEGNENGSNALGLDDSANPFAEANFDFHLVETPSTGDWTPTNGNDGDVIFGDADQDDIIGGSRGATPPADGGDTIFGNHAQDAIVGDNGDIARAGEGSCAASPTTDPDGTTTRCVTLTSPGGNGGAVGDFIRGNDENDDIYAGADGDLVHGDAGDDYVEGNGGSDGDADLDTTPDAGIGLYGDVGQDDLIGGTSQGDGGVADGADDVWGGQGHDVGTGDNADITRTGGGTCDGYVCNTFRGDVVDVVIRTIKIWDVDDQAAGDPAAGNSGGDMLGGEDGHDRLYGQGGGDRIEGGGNDDFAFGNAGSDTINGNDGQDDLVGGTGRTDSSSASSAADGRIDAGDVIQGQDDYDSISGDNSRMVRQTQDGDASDNTGLWKANTFNNAVDRLIALMDVATTADAAPLTNGTSGNDQLLGGDEDDVVYGQGGNDGISGGLAQDLLEGNANGTGNAPDPAGTYGGGWPVFAGDVIHGDAGADDVGGGTGRIYRMVLGVETQDPVAGVDGRRDGGDTIFGDEGGDALAGDNTVIERALQGGQWIQDDLLAPDALDVIRRIMRQRDVATTLDLAPLTNGTSGGDVIYGNDGVDVAYGQGGEDQIQGNAHDDHLEGNAGDDTITGNEGQDDVIGGTGRQFSNVEAGVNGAADGRIDNPTTDDAANDTLHGGNGLGAVASADDDAIIGDNGTVDRELGNPIPTLDKLPFNGTWTPASWDEPSIRRVIRLLDVATTANTAPEANGTNGDDTINGEANEDLLFGQGGNDIVTGDDADLLALPAPADANPGDDYIEGNGGLDTLRGDLGEDDIAGGGSAANGVLDANRDGELNPDRSGETLRDAGDLITGDSGDAAVGEGDVIGGDNLRIYRKLDAAGDWRTDAQRQTTLRDVFLFDIEVVGGADAADGESGVDSIFGNGGRDLLFGQDNGTDVDAYGNEIVVGDGNGAGANCQNATGGPGTGTLAGLEEAPNGDDDDDDLPDLNDPQCRDDSPGDKVLGQHADDYVEGNQGSDSLEGGEGEDDVIGGSSANTGHVNAILPPADRDAGFAPTALVEASKPNNLVDGHDVIQGNAEDDTVLGDNAFVDRYLAPSTGDWITIAGAGHAAVGELEVPNPEPAKAAYEASNLFRRDVTTKATTESAGAYGDDYIRGGTGQDDVYGTLGDDWLEGNENEDAIVGDMGKIVDNVLGQDDAIDPADPAEQFIVPQQPFLGATVNQTGVLKREVTLYAFNQATPATAGIGHDVALGGDGNDWIHTGPGEDLANGNAGDDRLFLGDNFTATTAKKTASESLLAHDRVDAGWGGLGYDHVWGGYGADYSDVRPRKAAEVPGLFPASDPETWFQIAGAGPTPGFPPPAQQELSQNEVNYAHGNDNFGDKDYHYGGWDQDTLQANIGDNGPHIGDRMLDWGGSYNGYYLCPSTYGDWVSTRAVAPGLISFLQQMSQGDGATTTATTGTSGFRETAIVFSNEVKDNTKPIHIDTPAHFTCGPGTTGP